MIVVLILVGALVVAGMFDWRARRRGSRVRRGGDIGREIRQQELWSEARQSINFQHIDDGDGHYSPDRGKRPGK